MLSNLQVYLKLSKMSEAQSMIMTLKLGVPNLPDQHCLAEQLC